MRPLTPVFTLTPAKPPLTRVDSIVSALVVVEASAESTRTAAVSCPPVAIVLRTILLAPSWNCTPSPLGLRMIESAIWRPATPVTETPGPLPACGEITTVESLETPPEAPLKVSRPLTATPAAVPAIVTPPTVKVAEP